MVEGLPISSTMALLGALCGLVLGVTARLGRFCTFSAIEDHQVGEDGRRLRSWGLAIATAAIGTQVLYLTNLVDISQSVYLLTVMPIMSLIIGGLSFGFGMALVGTCGFGSLVRLAGGDLKALVTLLVMGFTAYTTMRGLIGVGRFYALDPINITFQTPGAQSVPSLLVYWLPDSTSTIVCAGLLVSGLLIWCFKDTDFRKAPLAISTGIIMGATICAGWFFTGYFGNDDFDPQPVQSLGFIRPSADFLVYLMTWSGATINFSIGSVCGVLIGGCLAASLKREWRWEGFDDVREMKRHLIGATLMGFGGITMLGCTIGQGLSGLSTLSLGSFIAMLSLYIGATVGLHYVLEGSFREALTAIRYRFFYRD